MATSNVPVFVQTPKVGVVQIVNADSTTTAGKTIYTAGANGSKVVSLTATSDDTVTRVLRFYLTRSAVNYLLGASSITTLAGTDGAVASIDALSATYMPGLPRDNDGQKYIFMQSGDTLTCNVTVAVTAAKTVHVVAIAGDF